MDARPPKFMTLTAGLSWRKFELVPRVQKVGFVLDKLALGQGRPQYWERNTCHGYFVHHKFHTECPETETGPVR